MKAAAHRITQTYRITASSSVQGSGRLKPKRAVIWTMKVRNRAANSPAPTASAPRFSQDRIYFVALMRSSSPLGQTLAYSEVR